MRFGAMASAVLSMAIAMPAEAATANAKLHHARTLRRADSRVTQLRRNNAKQRREILRLREVIRGLKKPTLGARESFAVANAFAARHQFQVFERDLQNFDIVDPGRATVKTRTELRRGWRVRHVIVTEEEAPTRMAVRQTAGAIVISAAPGDIGLAETLRNRMLVEHKGTVTVVEVESLPGHVLPGSAREQQVYP
jgi:hypothetical protein